VGLHSIELRFHFEEVLHGLKAFSALSIHEAAKSSECGFATHTKICVQIDDNFGDTDRMHMHPQIRDTSKDPKCLFI
jgi:hypothetical protein